ncbi:MAG: sugar transferase [Chloroflexi bacterium]|nr:sugar transferase [Chloroflexota bacterium]
MSSQTYVPRLSSSSRRWTRFSFEYSGLRWRIRHLFDVTICILSFPIVLPIMALIALAIYVDSGRPVLFVQDRIGRGGKRFSMFKFRSLRKDHSSASDRAYMKAYINGELERKGNGTKQDLHKPFEQTHVTRVGRILRKTSLDELPQIFNVLRGEMSLVGPRPNVPWEVEAYRVWHIERLEGLPGITGLAQVRGRSGLTWDQMARYDIEYLRTKSLWLDIKILWWTVASILHGRGAG